MHLMGNNLGLKEMPVPIQAHIWQGLQLSAGIAHFNTTQISQKIINSHS